jgi:hypothetical protein
MTSAGLRALREAALADEGGAALAAALAKLGLGTQQAVATATRAA